MTPTSLTRSSPGTRPSRSAAVNRCCVVRELENWVGHSTAKLRAMRDGLEELRRRGAATIED